MVKVKEVKPGPPKAKKATPLKAKKTPKTAKTLKDKVAASPKFIALSKTDDGEFRKKTVQKRKAIQDDERRGVIVLSNIPHGFFEGEMRRYFRQFGVVENVRLVRSKKTGQSCGFAYVEFQHYEVAKIVAKHMNGYLTFGKIMKCKVIDPSKVSNKLFKGKTIRPDNCPKLNARKGAIRKLNKERTEKQIKRRKSRIKVTYTKKLKNLQELGVDIPLHSLIGVEEEDQQKSESGGKEQVESNAPTEDSDDIDPSKDDKPNLTKKQRKKMAVVRDELAAKIMEDLVEAGKAKTPKKSRTKTPGSESEMVIEVDQSDEEVVLKTPPNAVKKYVKMGDADSTPKDAATPKTGKATPKSLKGTPKSGKVTMNSGKGTPKVGMVAVNGTPKSGKSTPKQAKTTPKASKTTPTSAVTPKSSKKTPKSTKSTPKSPGTPPSKPGKGTPKSEPTAMETDDKPNLQESLEPEALQGTPKRTPKGKNKTPKAGKLAPIVPETMDDEEGLTTEPATPFKSKTRTPKVKEVTLDIDTPVSESKTPSKTPKAAKTTPKLLEMKTEAETPSKAKNKTPKQAKSTPKVSEPPLKADTPKIEAATQKLKNKTPKSKKSSPEEHMEGETETTPRDKKSQTPITRTPKMTLGEGTYTPKVRKTPKNKGTPAANPNSQDTPARKKKTPKAKGGDENGLLAGEVSTQLFEKLTPKTKTPRGTPTPGYDVAVMDTPKTTSAKKRNTSNLSHTPKATPGKRRQSEGGFIVTELTPTRTNSKMSPGRTGTPKSTPKMTPGKRKTPQLTPGSKVKKVKVQKES